MEKYCDTNLNYYIKIKLTEEGRIIYKKHYATKYNFEAPRQNPKNSFETGTKYNAQNLYCICRLSAEYNALFLEWGSLD